jgi:hypothetical protein
MDEAVNHLLMGKFDPSLAGYNIPFIDPLPPGSLGPLHYQEVCSHFRG